MEYPGYDEAIELGYSLYCHSGNHYSASYSKENLCLTVYENKTAELSSSYKLIRLHSGKFSFPHKNFHIFENQIMHLLNGVE